VLDATFLGVQAPIEPSLHRKSQVRPVWPAEAVPHDPSTPVPPAWVRHRENGIVYCLDVTRSMFASGNGTERMRAARFPAQGEVVVDLYAGIGYFTLALLVHAGATHVHACEWDEDTLEALRAGLEANGVGERCTVHAGDNALALPAFARQAHRVHLGLIPSSEDGWPVAVGALRAEGGWLHIHGNVGESSQAKADWVAHVERELSRLAADAGCRWKSARVAHVERVKKYAPRVEHLVADVHVVGTSGTS